MSQTKIDRKLHAKFIAKIDDEIRSGVTRILRNKFRNSASAIKVICRDTGAALRAARNWYDGENSPLLLHFVLLAQSYPELVDLFLGLCQCGPEKAIADAGDNSNSKPTDGCKTTNSDATKVAENVGNDVGNQSGAGACNSRQLWFMLRLQEGAIATAEALADCWRVSFRTAERDITDLRRRGLITYHGTKRNGRYLLSAHPDSTP